MVARENAKDGTADLLREWVENKDGDFREKEGNGGMSFGDEFGYAASIS
jgi:hypothetical protein